MFQVSVNTDQFSDVSDTEPVKSAVKTVRKRKQSVLDSSPTNYEHQLKRHNSLPDVRSTPGRSTPGRPTKRVPAPKTIKGKSDPAAPFRETLLGTFNDPSFQEGISPFIFNLVSPLIERSIQNLNQKAVNSAIEGMRQEVVKPLAEANEKLTQIVVENKDTIRQQQSRITELESEFDLLCTEVDDIKLSMNDLEQYGRRSNLRISNMMIGPPDATEAVITQHTVDFLNNSVLKVTPGSEVTPVTADDIDRCHPIGPMRSGKRNVI